MQIDAVLTWVDSSDEVWRNKINQYLDKKIDWKNKKESTRYNSINEIEISITSILKFANFIKNIYVVTDNQKPVNFDKLKIKALALNVNLELIDHKTIFRGYEEYLPTFNSQTIETMLYRIPNLSEHFIYFNDDFFLINKTQSNDFFKNSFPVLRGRWKDFDENVWYQKMLYYRKKKRVFSYRHVKEDSAKLIGFDKYFDINHTPYPLRKSTIEKLFDKKPELLERNLKYKFRHKNQFLLQGIVNHIELKNNSCFLKSDLALFYTHRYSWFSILKKVFKSELRGEKVLFLCLQNLENASSIKLKFLLKWIDKKLDSNFVQEL
ncbi:stealth family protein [Tenacibaculum haliotis]|uniref:stealth family protein n=1 Tax=Tenacibaculum haliotis TaxID=1888914 RepID=UPI0021B04FD9|nr:stealth family protein [Tenacibaculum haliotis]MCT4698890.1 stealth family protein [Tenacibaculum haliotis]